jgi:hypothetical protein
MTSHMDADVGEGPKELERAFRDATNPDKKLSLLREISMVSSGIPDARMAQVVIKGWRDRAINFYGLDANDVDRVIAEGLAKGRQPVDAQNAENAGVDRKVVALNGKPLDAELHRDAPRKPRTKDGDDDLATMNDKYAVVQIAGRTRVMYFEDSPAHPGSMVPVFQRKEDFVSFHLKHKKTFVDPNGKERETGIGHWWFNHSDRRQYDAVIYAPGIKTPPNLFNLWTGFSCEAQQGDCGLFLQHLRENICGGVGEYYEYLLNWMAMGVQHPDRQGKVAVVLRGQEGTGKGIFATTYGGLFGPHFVHVSSAKHLVGNFNAHLQQCSVLFADEAFFAGERSYESTLKTLITERTAHIEPKGVDSFTAPNRIHLIIASNSDWVIPAGAEARRFFMLDVSEASRQDGPYFSAIVEQLNSGGREALLFDLLHRDLSGFDVTVVPQTEALAKQKAHSRRDINRLVETIAHDGSLPWATDLHLDVAVTSGEADDKGFYVAARNLVPDLKHLGSVTIAQQLGDRWECRSWHSGDVRGIRFPPLRRLRELFDQKHGAQEWPPLEPVEWRRGV